MLPFEIEQVVSFDTETTGLNPYLGDLPFGFAFANSQTELYLDDRLDSKHDIYSLCSQVFGNSETSVLIHNAKFDMHHLSQWCIDNRFEPIEFKARIICTATLSRIANNDRLTTRIKDVAKDYGLVKSDAVDIWIRKNKAYRPDGEPDFSKVPHDIISKYAKQDARITYDLYFHLLNDIQGLERYVKTLPGDRSIFNIIDREEAVTKALFQVECTGVNIDSSYARRAFDFEKQRADNASARYTEITGRNFVDSGKAHAAAFIDSGYDERKLIKTEAGNYSFANEVLSSISSPITEAITEHRQSIQKADTFYGNFSKLCDASGRIHTNFRQDAARTFRLSSSNPNLQNIPKEKIGDFYERDCFIPPEGYTWVSIDYRAQEMRLLFDMAGEEAVAKRIIEGEDVHAVTASLMGVDRKSAKTIGFGLVYSMGVQTMADSLGVSFKDAQELKRIFFSSMPKSARFLQDVMRKAEKGFICNDYGRVFKFTKDFSYKAPNYLIQGTGSEIGKDALVELIKIYKQDRVRVVSLVHDEINFNIKDEHLSEIPNICTIMKNVYKHSILPMDVSVTKSKKSWGACD